MSAAILLILPVILLHVASFAISLHDRRMEAFASRVVAGESGYSLRYYELAQPDAEWNIIFIHGTPATAAVFGEQFRHPFPRSHLLAPDRPGFGASRPNLRRPTLDDHAAAIGMLLATVPARRTILVGHSYGAPVALLTALKFTDQVAGVVLIGGSIDPSQERIYTAQRVADWPIFSWLLPRSLRQCNRELLTLRGDLERLQAQLAKLAVPVLMLHGARDYQVPIANVDFLRTQLSGAGKSGLFEALVFPEYNHFIPWEHPDAVEQAIGRVTERLRE